MFPEDQYYYDLHMIYVHKAVSFIQFLWRKSFMYFSCLTCVLRTQIHWHAAVEI
jgi:hypothetical protein